ncbi:MULTISPECIES: ABC transporter ATP-binding protein [Cellulosimicrobium]|uniref:ABC transporter ATP-binding protein n=1 Tax=Cellulosimicrobium TaxID=157920 RepID=UPI0014593E00|nr:MULTISPECIES: ABC transporter ATP-binding protein [Cellulosimicrobium]MCM3534804.1 ABC transporter ATP-binding protein [Cellulosimicrobium funkei]MDQ8040776.1 ABC transporter ATP-binding protein [Cellulosimicrobium sp. XJ-DQ-B-000]NMF30359.1 ABC transporter ATP-binding protein [Cellulosimicrobium aquatile]
MVDPHPAPPVAPAGAPVPGTVPGVAPDPRPTAPPGQPAPPDPTAALSLRALWKRFGEKIAVAGIDLDVPAGSFYGLVGPNGAGKTTTLSMATGLLRPDAGSAHVHGTDLWADPVAGKRQLGVLPDGVRLFDRLTGAQLVTYAGLLRGMDRDTVAERTTELLAALDLAKDANTFVVDYSAGMTKKIALATALIHAPRTLVLDEPFEAVDPVSAANIRDILAGYVASGGTVVVSSHVMDLVQRMCDHVAVVAGGHVLAAGTVDAVRGDQSLEDRFVELVGGRQSTEGLAWLRSS